MNLPPLLLVPLLACACARAAEGVTVGQWNGMLVVTAPTGTGIAGLGPRAAQRLTLDVQDQPLSDTLDFLRAATGLAIVVAPAVQADPPAISLHVKDMALDNLLRWIERTGSVHIGFVNGALFVSDQPVSGASSTRIYDVRDLSARIQDFPGPSLSIPEPGGGGAGLLPPVATDERPSLDLDEIQRFIERFVVTK